MKQLTFLTVICLLFSCKKDKLFTDTAVISGPDVRACACCGGLYFHFTDMPDTTNRPLVNSGIFQFSNDVKYPVSVEVNWEKAVGCNGYAVKIINFKLL